MKIRTISCLASVLVMIGTPVWASPPTGDTPQRVALDIDTLGLGPDLGPRMELEIYAPLKVLLARQNYEVKGPGEATRTVLVTIGYLDDAHLNYAIHIDLVEQRGKVALTEWFACMACNERRLVEQTVTGFGLAVMALVELSEAEAEIEPPCAPVEPPPEPAQIGPLGFLGAGVGVGGLVTLGFGIGATVARNYTGRPAPELVVGIGAATLGFGLLAVATDLIGRKVAAKHGLRPEFSFSSARMSVGVSFEF